MSGVKEEVQQLSDHDEWLYIVCCLLFAVVLELLLEHAFCLFPA